MTPTSRAPAAQDEDAPAFSVLVNTCDAYGDCWEPFFTLAARYWPDVPQPILLNTERVSYRFPGLAITSVCNSQGEPEGKRLPWGEAVLRALDQVTTDVVLYLQDDYFLRAPVDTAALGEFAGIIREGGSDCIRLVETDNAGPWVPTPDPRLWEVSTASNYLVSLQAALWRTDLLRRALRRHENAWQFEVWGSKRLRRSPPRIHCLNRDRYGEGAHEVLPYEPTGIVQGRWVEGVVVGLFRDNGIAVDYDRRGFFREGAAAAPRRPLLHRAVARARSLW